MLNFKNTFVSFSTLYSQLQRFYQSITTSACVWTVPLPFCRKDTGRIWPLLTRRPLWKKFWVGFCPPQNIQEASTCKRKTECVQNFTSTFTQQKMNKGSFGPWSENNNYLACSSCHLSTVLNQCSASTCSYMTHLTRRLQTANLKPWRETCKYSLHLLLTTSAGAHT